MQTATAVSITKINGSQGRNKGNTPTDVIDFIVYLLSNNDNSKKISSLTTIIFLL